MPKYTVGKLWFFPEIGDKPQPGTDIELSEEAAERYMRNEPGLLKPARQTTQGRASDVRKEEAGEKQPSTNGDAEKAEEKKTTQKKPSNKRKSSKAGKKK